VKIKTLGAVTAALLVLGVPASPSVAADKDCSDFGSWRAAQNFYKSHGGPKRDPHRLDADHDGIACESLRY
jgi:excalibur calcium-binding domain-containing protein